MRGFLLVTRTPHDLAVLGKSAGLDDLLKHPPSFPTVPVLAGSCLAPRRAGSGGNVALPRGKLLARRQLEAQRAAPFRFEALAAKPPQEETATEVLNLFLKLVLAAATAAAAACG